MTYGFERQDVVQRRSSAECAGPARMTPASLMFQTSPNTRCRGKRQPRNGSTRVVANQCANRDRALLPDADAGRARRYCRRLHYHQMLDDDHYYMMIGSGIAERYHRRFFNMRRARPDRKSRSRFALTDGNSTGFNVAGPKSRAGTAASA